MPGKVADSLRAAREPRQRTRTDLRRVPQGGPAFVHLPPACPNYRVVGDGKLAESAYAGSWLSVPDQIERADVRIYVYGDTLDWDVWAGGKDRMSASRTPRSSTVGGPRTCAVPW